MKKQVNKGHYEFKSYCDKRRWASVWHQVDEVMAMQPKSVLEIGPGPGVFQVVASQFGLNVDTLDLDPELNLTYVASADKLPFIDSAYDVVCAFQMLEHIPYEISLKIFREMARVARKGIVISLPDAATRWPVGAYIPFLGMRWLSIPKPRLRAKKHVFDGQHYWELNNDGYSLSRVTDDLERVGQYNLRSTFRVDETPYHRFFTFVPSTFGA